FNQRVQLLVGQQQGEPDRRRRGSRGLDSSTRVFHWPSSSAAWRSWPRSSATSETTPGSIQVHQPIGLLPLVAAHQQSAGAAGRIGHVGTPLIEDQLEAGAKAIPAVLEGSDARVAAADL